MDWIVDKPTCRQGSITGATKISLDLCDMHRDAELRGAKYANSKWGLEDSRDWI